MAEEKKDGLEGLEDFDDDFGEQLDSFMDNDGEEESDSELDSFFEDLSTIDDLDGDGDNDSENNEETSDKNQNEETKTTHENDLDLEEEFTHEDEEIVNKNSDKNNKKKGFPLKATIISSITGIFLGIISLLVIFFVSSSSEEKAKKVVVKKTIEKSSLKKVIKPKIKAKIVKKKKKIPKKITKKTFYDIQVVSCISQECLDESRAILANIGYKSKIRNSVKKSGIAEVVSSDVLTEEHSTKIISKINEKNPLAGYAFSKPFKNGYQISLGYFPDLETANRVRTYLNQAFKESIFFEIKRSSQKINFQVLEVSNIPSIEDAEILLDKLKKNNPNFSSAFIKQTKKK